MTVRERSDGKNSVRSLLATMKYPYKRTYLAPANMVLATNKLARLKVCHARTVSVLMIQEGSTGDNSPLLRHCQDIKSIKQYLNHLSLDISLVSRA